MHRFFWNLKDVGEDLLGGAIPGLDHRLAVHLDSNTVVGFNLEHPASCGHPTLGFANQTKSVSGKTSIPHGRKNARQISR